MLILFAPVTRFDQSVKPGKAFIMVRFYAFDCVCVPAEIGATARTATCAPIQAPLDAETDVAFLFGYDMNNKKCSVRVQGMLYRVIVKIPRAISAEAAGRDIRYELNKKKPLRGNFELNFHEWMPTHGYQDYPDTLIEVNIGTASGAKMVKYHLKAQYDICESDVDPRVVVPRAMGTRLSQWCDIDDVLVSQYRHTKQNGTEYYIQGDFRNRAILVVDPPPPPSMSVMCFDIETFSTRKEDIPLPDQKQAIMYAVAVTMHDIGDIKTQRSILLFLLPERLGGEIVEEDITGYNEVHIYTTEKSLISGFFSMIESLDPDIIQGYNIIQYDLLWMLERGSAYDAAMVASWGRLWDFSDEYYVRRNGAVDTRACGRIIHDVYKYCKDDVMIRKLPTLTLKAVAKTVLVDIDNGEKIDLSYEQQHQYYKTGGKGEMLELAAYVLRDSELPHMIMERKNAYLLVLELSRATGTQLHDLVNNGALVSNFYCLFNEAHERGRYLAPLRKHGSYMLEGGFDRDALCMRIGKVEGGMVFQPNVGLKGTSVTIDGHIYYIFGSVLDFASLYPTTIHACNIDSMRVMYDSEAYKRIKALHEPGASVDKSKRKAPVGADFDDYIACFKRDMPPGHVGVQPEILARGNRTRKVYKNEIAQIESDLRGNRVEHIESAQKRIKQLSAMEQTQKVINNSLYGTQNMEDRNPATGQQKRFYYTCPVLAAATTAGGRYMLQRAKMYATEPHNISVNGHVYQIHDTLKSCISQEDTEATTHMFVENVYGDTDSIFPWCYSRVELSRETQMEVITEMAKDITVKLDAHIVHKYGATPGLMLLEPEKLIHTAVFKTKKQYAYYNGKKLTIKGMIKRDVPPVVLNTLTEMLETRLRDDDKLTTLKILQKTIDDIVKNNLPIESYVLTRSLTTPIHELKNKQANPIYYLHKCLAGTPDQLSVGDRVEFVYSRKTTKPKYIAEQATPLIHASLKNIDRNHYLSMLIKKAMVDMLYLFNDYNKKDLEKMAEDARADLSRQYSPLARSGGWKVEITKKRSGKGVVNDHVEIVKRKVSNSDIRSFYASKRTKVV